MISCKEDLVAQASQIEEKEEQIKFIMNYFLENVQYNYAYLFAKGYAEGSISKVSSMYGLGINKTRIDGDSEFSITQSAVEGESKIHEDILDIRDKNSDDYNKFVEELRSYITDVIKSHINNETIVSKSVDSVMNQIEKCLRVKSTIKYNDMDIECNNDISKVLIDFILKPKDYFPPEYDNGLIKSGVCEDYTNYLVDLFKELGIEAHNIGGTSELGHAWIIVKVKDEYKSVDLTRAVFIRDGFKGIPKEQTSEDWLYTDLDKMFTMQKTRTITEIDGRKLESIISGKNYSAENFSELMNEISKKEPTIRSLVKNALEGRITVDDIRNAEKEQQRNNAARDEENLNIETD